MILPTPSLRGGNQGNTKGSSLFNSSHCYDENSGLPFITHDQGFSSLTLALQPRLGKFCLYRSHKRGSLLLFYVQFPAQPLCPQGHVCLLFHLDLVSNVHFSLLLPNAALGLYIFVSSLLTSFCPNSCQHRAGNQYIFIKQMNR